MEASLWEAALVLEHAVKVLQMTKGRQPISIREIEQSTIRGARGGGVFWPLITPDHGWIGDSQPVGWKLIEGGYVEYFLHSPRHVPNLT